MSSGRPTTTVRRLAVRSGRASVGEDELATEEPLEIRAESPCGTIASIAVTMRTPGSDAELAVGFLFTEGLLRGASDLAEPPVVEQPDPGGGGDVATVRFAQSFDASRLARNFAATSSCGVCGKTSLDHIATGARNVGAGPVVGASLLFELPERLRAAQPGFERTGGLHATGIFAPGGELAVLREDVGRHNAMDKAIGQRVLDGATPLADCVLLVSGRASFELVQKAAMAGGPILCAVSAPSSLAVGLAERLGVTLVGFLRGRELNVYTHPERIDLAR